MIPPTTWGPRAAHRGTTRPRPACASAARSPTPRSTTGASPLAAGFCSSATRPAVARYKLKVVPRRPHGPSRRWGAAGRLSAGGGSTPTRPRRSVHDFRSGALGRISLEARAASGPDESACSRRAVARVGECVAPRRDPPALPRSPWRCPLAPRWPGPTTLARRVVASWLSFTQRARWTGPGSRATREPDARHPVQLPAARRLRLIMPGTLNVRWPPVLTASATTATRWGRLTAVRFAAPVLAAAVWRGVHDPGADVGGGRPERARVVDVHPVGGTRCRPR